MQLYALEGSIPLLATRASKEKIYRCPECQAAVKARSGPLRQPHFYHLRTAQRCRQQGKSEEHLMLQLHLLSLLGEGAQLECPFPAISRIADIAWHAHKIVFEIQCSPLSLEEAQARNHDYLKIGYTPIWILHDKRFNKKNLSAAEHYLRSTGCYFTNSNRWGKGEIYDQFDAVNAHRRFFTGPKLVLSLERILRTPQIFSTSIALPQLLQRRFLNWPYYFQGDLVDHFIQEGPSEKISARLLNIEKRYESSQTKRLPMKTLFAKSYCALLHLLIKRIS